MGANVFSAAALGLALAAGPAPKEAPSRQPSATAPRGTVGALWVRTADVDFTGLRRDLQLRLNDVEITTFEDPRPTSDGLVVFVDVSASEGGYQLTLVASDGRAYDRAVPVDAGLSPVEHRLALARNIANLVEGIAEGTTPADRDDVALPVSPPELAPVAACPDPAPEPKCPAVPVDDPPPALPGPPQLEFGPVLSVGPLLGVGPPADADRFAATSGSAGFRARWRSGGLLVLRARLAGRSHAQRATMLRVRVAAGGGYIFRPDDGTVEVSFAAGGSVEPWFVFRGGQRIAFGGQPPPLLGAWGRTGVAHRFGRRGDAMRVAVGAWAEFAASYLPGGTGPIGRVLAEVDGELVPLFRVGGTEVSMAVKTTIWLPSQRGHARR